MFGPPMSSGSQTTILNYRGGGGAAGEGSFSPSMTFALMQPRRDSYFLDVRLFGVPFFQPADDDAGEERDAGGRKGGGLRLMKVERSICLESRR